MEMALLELPFGDATAGVLRGANNEMSGTGNELNV